MQDSQALEPLGLHNRLSQAYNEHLRVCVSAALALVYSNKIPVVSENVFSALFNDRLVAKGVVLDFLTVFFQVHTHRHGRTQQNTRHTRCSRA